LLRKQWMLVFTAVYVFIAACLNPICGAQPSELPHLRKQGTATQLIVVDAVRLHAALDKVGVPNQLLTIRGGKHGGFNRQALVNGYATIQEFLRKYNLLPTE